MKKNIIQSLATLIPVLLLSASLILQSMTLDNTNKSNDKLIKGYQDMLHKERKAFDEYRLGVAIADSVQQETIAAHMKIIKKYEAMTKDCIGSLNNCNKSLSQKHHENNILLSGWITE